MRSYFYKYDKEKEAYVVNVALPGLTRDKVKIEMDDDGCIVIRANSEENLFYVQPVVFTYVSKIDIDKAKAEMENGALTLTLPLKNKKQIAIK